MLLQGIFDYSIFDSYVPYNGATAGLNLGTHNFLTTGTISDGILTISDGSITSGVAATFSGLGTFGELTTDKLNTPYAQTVTVAKSGGDYTTIQAAINYCATQSPTANNRFCVLIYPGDYAETITGSSYVELMGMNAREAVNITGATGPLYTFPVNEGHIFNLKFSLSPTTSAQNVISIPSGMVARQVISNCLFVVSTASDVATTVFKVESGEAEFINNKVLFSNTDTTGGTIRTQRVWEITGDAIIDLYSNIVDVDIYDINKRVNIFQQDESTAGGEIHIKENVIRVDSHNAGAYSGIVRFITYNGTTATLHVAHNFVELTSAEAGGSGVGEFLRTNSTGSGLIRSTANHVVVSGFATNRWANCAAGDTIVSHFDNIVAVDGFTGAGTITYANSLSDGAFTATGYLGIGTDAPWTSLNLVTSDSANGLSIDLSQDAASNSYLYFLRSRGTPSAKTAVAQNTETLRIQGYGYDGDSYEGNVGIHGIVPDGATVSDGDVPGQLNFHTREAGDGATSLRMTIESNGDINSQAGNITTTGDVRIVSDSSKLEIGALAGGDLQAYHNGTNSYINNLTGIFYIQNASGNNSGLRFDGGDGATDAAGGALQFDGGAAGALSASGTGKVGGGFILAGGGGGASSIGGGANVGGAGGAYLGYGGTGGEASNGTSDTGGAGGAATVRGGIGGAGDDTGGAGGIGQFAGGLGGGTHGGTGGDGGHVYLVGGAGGDSVIGTDGDGGNVYIDGGNGNAVGNIYLGGTRGKIRIGDTTAPTLVFEVKADSIRIVDTQTPASNGTGTQGEIAWDADYIYVCTATDTWKRAALTGGY